MLLVLCSFSKSVSQQLSHWVTSLDAVHETTCSRATTLFFFHFFFTHAVVLTKTCKRTVICKTGGRGPFRQHERCRKRNVQKQKQCKDLNKNKKNPWKTNSPETFCLCIWLFCVYLLSNWWRCFLHLLPFCLCACVFPRRPPFARVRKREIRDRKYMNETVYVLDSCHINDVLAIFLIFTV